MKSTALQTELHKIIDQVQDQEILLAVRTLLSSQLSPVAYSEGVQISKAQADQMLQESEKDIRQSRTIDHQALKQETRFWRKRSFNFTK